MGIRLLYQPHFAGRCGQISPRSRSNGIGLIQFLFALHNHQPVGNFENVFREAFEKCYDPFIRFLEEHQSFRITLHYSGCLFDWLEVNEKQFLRRLERLVQKKQVEMLGGGYYEPILPLIPEKDAIDQLRFMNQYLEKRFHQTPSGFWLTERVWESKIPRLAAGAGLRYTAVDDTHFALAGLPESQIKDFFITEEEGSPLYLFPIPTALRYLIPFREPAETLDYFKKLNPENSKPAIVTYADDGEKLGLWPGTYQWVFREGWLDRFAKALDENRAWIQMKTFSEVLSQEKREPIRKVYLPSASYEEMTHWALCKEKGQEFNALKKELEQTGLWSRSRNFFQGGTFKNFLAKYSEADWMRSKMRWVSQKVRKIKNPSLHRRAAEELWKGQCNCPYWHGVFGGLYLHHLRRNTYGHLIRAEQLGEGTRKTPPPIEYTTADLNQDGQDEAVIQSYPFSFYFAPHRGGSLLELDYLPQSMNVLDVMTRREEAYHLAVLHEKKNSDTGKSIHDIDKTIAPETLERVGFDFHERLSSLDLFFDIQTAFEQYWKGDLASSLVSHPTRIPYEKNWRKDKTIRRFTLRGEQGIRFQDKKINLLIEKVFEIQQGLPQFQVSWDITNASNEKCECLFGSEWNFNFFERARREKEVDQIEIQDGWSPIQIKIHCERGFDYWQFPIETIAQTEKDFRLLHQGISVFPHWRLRLNPRQNFQQSLTISFSDGNTNR